MPDVSGLVTMRLRSRKQSNLLQRKEEKHLILGVSKGEAMAWRQDIRLGTGRFGQPQLCPLLPEGHHCTSWGLRTPICGMGMTPASPGWVRVIAAEIAGA